MDKIFFEKEKATLFRDVIFSADDSLITTFAIIAGSTGAHFPHTVVIAMGLANLIADAISFGNGIYLGIKSELEMAKKNICIRKVEGKPIHHAVVSFFSFMFFGSLPLIPYFINFPYRFPVSVAIIILSLFTVGAVKAIYTEKNFIKSGLEMLGIGGISAVAAYLVGFLADKYIIK